MWNRGPNLVQRDREEDILEEVIFKLRLTKTRVLELAKRVGRRVLLEKGTWTKALSSKENVFSSPLQCLTRLELSDCVRDCEECVWASRHYSDHSKDI